MIFFTPYASGNAEIEKGLFLSTEMSHRIATEVTEGRLEFSQKLIPVHPPWDGIYKADLGDHDGNRISEQDWLNAGLPPMYKGEPLDGKKLIIFPMHGLGDQLYLAASVRSLVHKYDAPEIVIVRPAIESAEKWYRFIYHDSFFTVTGPVVSASEMNGYDYYVNAEHFAHIDDYRGTYPPAFYMTHLFHNDAGDVENVRPEICPVETEKIKNAGIDSFVSRLRLSGNPVVFVSSMTTGRVRDILPSTILEFTRLCCDRYAFIVSAYQDDDLAISIDELDSESIRSAGDLLETIEDLIYLLRQVDYIITSDSGITHLAESLGKPCGTVFNVVTPEERTKPYRFSEQLVVAYEIPDVCKTPCYFHALSEEQNCAGMKWVNDSQNTMEPRRFAPCMENLNGQHLELLLNSLFVKFGGSNTDLSSRKQVAVDRIIDNNVFRKDVFDRIPENSSRILDFGCNQGELLLRLKRDKGCRELYGIEVNKASKQIIEEYLDGGWVMDLGDETAELPSEFHGFFNYMILHDVVEHLYDPWYVLEKLRTYLAPSGKIIIVVPNLQYWGILNEIISGRFPYGGGGLMNEDHIRWFTCSSIIELLMIAGYDVTSCSPLFPPNTDLSGYQETRTRNELFFPPAERQNSGGMTALLKFQTDLKKNYYLFLANKILLVCTNTARPVNPEKLTVGGLQKRKEKLDINFNFELS